MSIVTGIALIAGLWIVMKCLKFIITIYNFICCYRAISALIGASSLGFLVGNHTDFKITDLNFSDVLGVFAKADEPKSTFLGMFAKSNEPTKSTTVPNIKPSVVPNTTKETPPKEVIRDAVKITRKEAIADNLGPDHSSLVTLAGFILPSLLFVFGGLFLIFKNDKV